jgi:hypothetical protein
MNQKQKTSMPAIQRINQTTSPVIDELSWILENSPSIKARRQAGKAILQFQLGQDYAERAYTFHDLKESQTEESQTGNKQQRYRSRYQGQES